MTSTTARAQEIAAFYARYASRVQRIVSTNVNAHTQTIEDACQNAWATLLRREDVTLDEHDVAWLARSRSTKGGGSCAAARSRRAPCVPACP